MTAIEDRCSFASARRGDDLHGTAPTATHFMLIEEPGAWGRVALEQSGLDRDVGLALAQACGQRSTRPLLIRRPGRNEQPVRKRWYFASTAVGAAGCQTGTFGADGELLDVLEAAHAGHAVGTPVTTPLFAVCTHGRHDACCAIKGRPVAAAMAAEVGEGAWETSHLGGDRFAGNVLVLPWGLYYGRIDLANAGDLVEASQSGRVLPGQLRGRSTFAPAAQAAQEHARAESGRTEIEAHTPRAVRKLAGQAFEVTLDGPHAGEQWQVTVEKLAGGPPALLTCAAHMAAAPPTWELVSITDGEPQKSVAPLF